MTIEQSLIEHSQEIARLNRINKVLRSATLRSLAYIQTRVNSNVEFQLLKDLQDALDKDGIKQ